MDKFIEELENNQKINLEKGLENKVDISYVIERLKDIRLWKETYKSEIEYFIEGELLNFEEYPSCYTKEDIEESTKFLESLTDEDIDNISESLVHDDGLNEEINRAIRYWVYHYKKIDN